MRKLALYVVSVHLKDNELCLEDCRPKRKNFEENDCYEFYSYRILALRELKERVMRHPETSPFDAIDNYRKEMESYSFKTSNLRYLYSVKAEQAYEVLDDLYLAYEDAKGGIA